MSTLESILKEINKADNIVLLAHENPDGDAIGSCLAMGLALKDQNKNVEIVMPKYPRAFSNLPGTELIKKEGSTKKYDLAIALDCATVKLLNGWTNYFEDAKSKIVIDHHSTNAMFGDLNYVDYSAPACAQVLYTMFMYYKWEITQDIGTDLMTGIITDTGGFQYSGTSKETFEIAARLLSVGVNIPKIYKQVFSTCTRSSYELKKLALDRLEFLENNKVTFTYITKEDEEKVNAETGDYEGIVNEGKNVEGVEVSIFIHEIDNGMKVSLRSNDYVNVSNICLMFGGGGHPRAAGVTMQGKVEDIKEMILREVKRVLK